jgi:hypothetical protein
LLNILSSHAESANKAFNKADRENGQDNVAWVREHASKGKNQTVLVMVGGRSPTAFRLRLAQAQVRRDLLPSYWSHVMLVEKFADDPGSTKIHEISLEPRVGLNEDDTIRHGFGFPATDNGVQVAKLSQYASPEEYPNIAVLGVPVKLKEVLGHLERFKQQRAILDGVDLIVRWLAYVWGVARSPNPLLDGLGIPSAAMLEIIVGACQFDLTPGLESRSSCPEAIWQAATWWHEYYEGQNKKGISGAYFCPHPIE